jgi:hypothetical protein
MAALEASFDDIYLTRRGQRAHHLVYHGDLTNICLNTFHHPFRKRHQISNSRNLIKVNGLWIYVTVTSQTGTALAFTKNMLPPKKGWFICGK